MRTLQTIDYSEARQAVDLITAKLSEMNRAAVAVVADAHGDPICLARMDGAPISSIHIAMNKAWTAARERKPTKDIGDKVKHPERGHDIAYYGDQKYVGWGGGIRLIALAVGMMIVVAFAIVLPTQVLLSKHLSPPS